MSNIIPPLLSNSPPPPPTPEEEDDDDFGDFTGHNDCSYSCDNLSLPSTPEHSPTKLSILSGLDINFNGNSNTILPSEDTKLDPEKDFQDKRKCDSDLYVFTPTLIVNSSVEKNDVINSFNNLNMTKDILQPLEDLHINSPESDDVDIFQKRIHMENGTKNGIKESHYDKLSSIKSDEMGKISVLTINEISSDVRIIPPDYDKLSSIKSDEIGEISVLTINEIASDVRVISPDVPNDSNDHSNVIERVAEKFGDSVSSYLTEDNIEGNAIKPTILEKLNPTTSIGVQDEKLFKTDDMPAISNTDDISFEKHMTLSPTEEIQAADYVDDLSVSHDISIKTDEQIYTDELGIINVENNPDITSTCLNTETKIFQNSEDDSENFDFAVTTNSDIEDITSNKNVEHMGDEYAFGNFISNNMEECSHISSEEEFGEFANFSSHRNSSDYGGGNLDNCDNNSDDFGDFTYSAFDSPNTSKEPEDFGNFASFSEPQKPVMLLLDEKEAFEKANEILKEMFPCYEDVQEDFERFVYEKDNFIFNNLQDITDTPALAYQWSKSASQKMLLMSLNIDARNILYGPSWNPSMPRFAANLSLEPLEPMKTECLSPAVQKSSPSQSASTQQPSIDIPSVQFDWNSSGLTNPLDSVSKDSVQEPPATSPNNVTIGMTTITTSVVETELVPKKVPSKTDLEEKTEDFDEFHDFTSFQSSTVSPVTQNWSNTVPLRETYISNDNIPVNNFPKDLPLDVEAWLQPTIVTPELPRKRSISQDEELSNICTPKSPNEEIVSTIEDDFDDFQMVLPKSKTDVLRDLTKSDILTPMKTLENKLMPDSSKINLSQSEDSNVNLGGKIIPPIIKPVVVNTALTNITNTAERKLSNSDEDEFTDFHFSTPAESSDPQKQVTTIHEPLKPTPIYSSAVTVPSTQINWPDPGITEEELKKFDDVFSRPIRINNDERKKFKEEPKTTVNVPRKTNIVEDDEWTEFVSVQKPSPIHKVKLNEHERTASPDLPLSVFNLGCIQPTKQPIPVITPQGIFQTKLSSNPTRMSPKASIKSNFISPKPMYQTAPSIISQQYASHAYSFSNNHNRQKNHDDDEWGEFVSSPLPAQSVSNGYQQRWHNNSSQHYGFENSSPNIIMNPGHFVQNGSDGRKVPDISVNRKSTVPNIVLPELDFVAPKARTSSTRKK